MKNLNRFNSTQRRAPSYLMGLLAVLFFTTWCQNLSASSGSEKDNVIPFPGQCRQIVDAETTTSQVGPDRAEPIESTFDIRNAKWVREKEGIQVVSSDREKTVYRMQSGVSVVISTENFSNYFEALSFCNSIDISGINFNLVSVYFAYSLVTKELPFENLRETALIRSRVLQSDFDDQQRSGVLFWAGNSDLSGNPFQVFGFTDGTGDHLGGWQSLLDLNQRLTDAGESEVSLPAVCTNLRSTNEL